MVYNTDHLRNVMVISIFTGQNETKRRDVNVCLVENKKIISWEEKYSRQCKKRMRWMTGPV